ncbi:MAG TPA: GerAB/ArcD/ProY family transporter [Symbiobacteriaceae bacterium]|jgi:hypothetical protein
MKKPAKISEGEFQRAMIATLVVRTFYASPAGAGEAVSTAAPWVVLLAGAAAALCFWPVAAALSRRPAGQNLVDLCLDAGGRPLAIVVTLAIGFFLVGSAGISLRQLSEMTVTAIYPHTPQTYAMVGLAVASTAGAAMDVAGLAWMGSVYAWPTVIVVLLVLAGNFGWTNYRAVLPLTGHGLLPIAGAVLPLSSYFGELVFLTVYARFVVSPKQIVRTGVSAVGVSALVLSAVVLVYLMVFPLPSSLDVPFGLFELTRLVQGGRYVERLDALWIIFWAFGTAGVTAASLQVTAILWQGAFRLPDYRRAILPLAVTMVAVALLPSNQAAAVVFEVHGFRNWGFLITLVLPLAVTLLARLRKRASDA